MPLGQTLLKPLATKEGGPLDGPAQAYYLAKPASPYASGLFRTDSYSSPNQLNRQEKAPLTQTGRSQSCFATYSDSDWGLVSPSTDSSSPPSLHLRPRNTQLSTVFVMSPSYSYFDHQLLLSKSLHCNKMGRPSARTMRAMRKSFSEMLFPAFNLSMRGLNAIVSIGTYLHFRAIKRTCFGSLFNTSHHSQFLTASSSPLLSLTPTSFIRYPFPYSSPCAPSEPLRCGSYYVPQLSLQRLQL